MRWLGLAVFLFIAVAALAGCSSTNEPGSSAASPTPSSLLKRPINGLVQSDTGGKVVIDVTWIGPQEGALLFDVAMNTHSVNLDKYDLGELAVLHDDEGKEHRPTSWDSAAGGHHRSGILVFSIPDSLSQGSAKYIELVIRDIAGIKERVLKWELD